MFESEDCLLIKQLNFQRKSSSPESFLSNYLFLSRGKFVQQYDLLQIRSAKYPHHYKDAITTLKSSTQYRAQGTVSHWHFGLGNRKACSSWCLTYYTLPNHPLKKSLPIYIVQITFEIYQKINHILQKTMSQYLVHLEGVFGCTSPQCCFTFALFSSGNWDKK